MQVAKQETDRQVGRQLQHWNAIPVRHFFFLFPMVHFPLLITQSGHLFLLFFPGFQQDQVRQKELGGGGLRSLGLPLLSFCPLKSIICEANTKGSAFGDK